MSQKLKERQLNMIKRKAISLLLAWSVLWGLTGCGDKETVHTSAKAQETEESAETGTEESAEETGAEELAEEETTQPEEKTNAVAAQTEIDEETKNELTAELLEEQKLDTSVMDNTRVTKGCTFTLPEAFEEAEDVPGMYVTKRYPIDASTIYYVALKQDVSLQLMTEETFQAQAQDNLRQIYDEDIEVSIDSFERIQIEDYPAFRILCHYQVGEIEITQLEYVINADKSYVITYSQTGDYDRMEEYEASAETIQLEY